MRVLELVSDPDAIARTIDREQFIREGGEPDG